MVRMALGVQEGGCHIRLRPDRVFRVRIRDKTRDSQDSQGNRVNRDKVQDLKVSQGCIIHKDNYLRLTIPHKVSSQLSSFRKI